MIEKEAETYYEQSVEEADNVLLYDGLIELNTDKVPENVENVRSFTTDMLVAVMEWKKDLILYRNKLKEILDELEADV